MGIGAHGTSKTGAYRRSLGSIAKLPTRTLRASSIPFRIGVRTSSTILTRSYRRGAFTVQVSPKRAWLARGRPAITHEGAPATRLA